MKPEIEAENFKAKNIISSLEMNYLRSFIISEGAALQEWMDGVGAGIKKDISSEGKESLGRGGQGVGS